MSSPLTGSDEPGDESSPSRSPPLWSSHGRPVAEYISQGVDRQRSIGCFPFDGTYRHPQRRTHHYIRRWWLGKLADEPDGSAIERRRLVSRRVLWGEPGVDSSSSAELRKNPLSSESIRCPPRRTRGSLRRQCGPAGWEGCHLLHQQLRREGIKSPPRPPRAVEWRCGRDADGNRFVCIDLLSWHGVRSSAQFCCSRESRHEGVILQSERPSSPRTSSVRCERALLGFACRRRCCALRVRRRSRASGRCSALLRSTLEVRALRPGRRRHLKKGEREGRRRDATDGRTTEAGGREQS